ncbi:MAG TPA: ATP-binding protein [Gaiellaceae bacterium]|nr:ATP-binding protein [Gaiellaceae bacterium]
MSEARRELEASVLPRASSIDGREFAFQCSLEDVTLQVGGYVSIGDGTLGQVHSLEQAWVEGAELAAAVGSETAHAPHVRIALARGSGVVLGSAHPFHDVPLERAAPEAVARWLEGARASRAELDIGELVLEPGVRFPLDAGGFDRHTFLCGQSGSGKTYALGTMLEQLLLETSLRIVVLDPNSDFVRVGDVRAGVDDASAERYASAVSGLVVRRGGGGPDRLHVRFTDCDGEEQAAVLHLDPVRDRDEYGALVDLVDGGFERSSVGARGLAAGLLASERDDLRTLGARVRNLGVHRWQIWSEGDEGALQDLVAPGGPRALVVDLGSLDTTGEKAIAAESVLAALWRRRSEREPVLIVIDEAHNVCPREPGDPVTALATEHAARIAAEGRKFGLYLLVSTQRPHRVNELVVSQCDNLVLMRMASTGDLSYVADVLSVAPRALLERATSFRMGESLVGGKIASHPAFVRFGPRISEEGGADVPATWARGAP